MSTADQLITTTEEEETDLDGDFIHVVNFSVTRSSDRVQQPGEVDLLQVMVLKCTRWWSLSASCAVGREYT
jgi:hypothetical protein